MKILFACEMGNNPYIFQLVNALANTSDSCCVQTSLKLFWFGDIQADIVHIHWPHQLFEWEPRSKVDDENIALLRERLLYLKQKCRIVSTVHNLYSHNTGTHKRDIVYDIVYSLSDAFIHLGKSSVDLFNIHHRDDIKKIHGVICHGDYSFFKNDSDIVSARRFLGIGDDRYICLVFGNIRNKNELLYTVKGFRLFKKDKKEMIIAGRLKWPKGKIQLMYGRIQNLFNIKLHNGFIRHNNVQYYLNAADVVIVPRLEGLNSGNIPLGFTFGKVVVGPNLGIMGEILKDSSNPTFDPRDYRTLAKALDQSVKLNESNKGLKNKIYASKHMNWNDIAIKHIKFYNEVLNRTHPTNEYNAVKVYNDQI